MRTKLFTLIFLMNAIVVSGQNIQEGNIYTVSELNIGLTNDLKNVVTREDLLSLALNDIQFTLDRTNTYLVDITVNCFKENEDKPCLSYSYAFNDLKVVKDGNTITFSSDFKPIFFNISTRDANRLAVEIRFTKLEDKQVTAFKRIANDYLNTVSATLNVGGIVKDILGIGVEEKKTAEEFKFVANFYMPLNFKEYYEQSAKQVPVITNEKTMLVSLVGDKPVQNNSLVGKLKSLLNAGTKIIFNKSVVDAKDVEKVTGYATLYFTTNFNSSIPQSLINSLRKLKDNCSKTNTDATSESIKECRSKLEEFRNENPSARRLYSNTTMYVDLIEIFNEKIKNDIIDFSKSNSGVISRFSNWLSRTSLDAPIYNYTKIYVRDIYDNVTKNATVLAYNDARIFFPYSLDNESTLFVVNLEQQLHQYVKDYFTNIPKPENQYKYFTDQHQK